VQQTTKRTSGIILKSSPSLDGEQGVTRTGFQPTACFVGDLTGTKIEWTEKRFPLCDRGIFVDSGQVLSTKEKKQKTKYCSITVIVLVYYKTLKIKSAEKSLKISVVGKLFGSQKQSFGSTMKMNRIVQVLAIVLALELFWGAHGTWQAFRCCSENRLTL